MKLRWKKEDRATGLRAVTAGERGSYYHDGDKKYATVSSLRNGFGPTIGWYWVAGWNSGVPHKNTCSSPCGTEKEAKAQAAAYVKKHISSDE